MKIENKKAYIPCEIVENQINNGLDIRLRIDKTHDLYINRNLLIPDIDQPEIEVLDMLYTDYQNEIGRNVEGFIINSGNSVSKYVRLKDGKLTEHHA